MEFKENDRVLICQRVADFEPAVQSHVDTCVLCARPVWRARSSPEADYVICLPCGRKQLAQYPEAKIGEPTKEQLEEARWWWRNFGMPRKSSE
jgi:hypothetical protein